MPTPPSPTELDIESGEGAIWGKIMPGGLLYQPTTADDPDAVPLVLLPVATGSDDPPVDIVAWDPDNPQAWWLRTGNARILGDHMFLRGEHQPPIEVVETPADYLYDRVGRAMCIVAWGGVDLIELFAGGPPLAFATDRLRRRFDRRWGELVERERAKVTPRYRVSS